MTQTIIVSISIIALFFYYYEIVLPIKREQIQVPIIHDQDLYLGWMDLIQANINTSFSAYHCHQCRKLIILFDQRFRKEIPPHIFNEWVDNMYSRLDHKYKAVLTEDTGLSDLTSSALIS